MGLSIPLLQPVHSANGFRRMLNEGISTCSNTSINYIPTVTAANGHFTIYGLGSVPALHGITGVTSLLLMPLANGVLQLTTCTG